MPTDGSSYRLLNYDFGTSPMMVAPGWKGSPAYLRYRRPIWQIAMGKPHVFRCPSSLFSPPNMTIGSTDLTARSYSALRWSWQERDYSPRAHANQHHLECCDVHSTSAMGHQRPRRSMPQAHACLLRPESGHPLKACISAASCRHWRHAPNRRYEYWAEVAPITPP